MKGAQPPRAPCKRIVRFRRLGKPGKDGTAVWTVPKGLRWRGESALPRSSALDVAAAIRRGEEAARIVCPQHRSSVVALLHRKCLTWFVPFAGRTPWASAADTWRVGTTGVGRPPPYCTPVHRFMHESLALCGDERHGTPGGVWVIRDSPEGILHWWVPEGETLESAGVPLDRETADCTSQEGSAHADAAPVAEVREWLMDTGSAYDLVASPHVKRTKGTMFERSTPLVLRTANGPVEVKHGVTLDLPPLGESTDALLLRCTPPVLSIGRRVMEDRCSFLWCAGKPAAMIRRDGLIVDCLTRSNIPYLAEDAVPRRLSRKERRACFILGMLDPGEVSSGESSGGEQTPTRKAFPATVGGSSGSGLRREEDAAADDSVGRGDDLPEGVGGDVGEVPASPGDAGVERRKAKEWMEHLLTHEPSRRDCEVCRNAKRRRPRGLRVCRPTEAEPDAFGEEFTLDHLLPQRGEVDGLYGDSYAVVCHDRATGWVDCIPVVDKSGDVAAKALWDVLGPRDRPTAIYTDGSGELSVAVASVKEVYPEVAHYKSLPYRPSTNGRIERMNQTVLGGTRAALWQAGAPLYLWHLACRHYCLARNTAVVEGDSAWHRRLRKGHFGGKRIPFGARVTYLPEGSKPAKFDRRMQDGIFAGWDLQPGGKWRGYYLVIPWSYLLDLDYSVTYPINPIRTVQTQVVELPDSGVEFPLVGPRDRARLALSEGERRNVWLEPFCGDDGDDGDSSGTDGGDEAGEGGPPRDGDAALDGWIAGMDWSADGHPPGGGNEAGDEAPPLPPVSDHVVGPEDVEPDAPPASDDEHVEEHPRGELDFSPSSSRLWRRERGNWHGGRRFGQAQVSHLALCPRSTL